MNRFLQLHLLTAYPPANLNRDDQGRPKTARMGGVDRLRVSSQSLKRHWRTSELFQQALGDHIGTRTKRLGVEVYNQLIDAGVKEKDAITWAGEIAGQFGKCKKADKKDPLNALEIEQLVHVSQEERDAVMALTDKLAVDKRAPEREELDFLRRKTNAADIALFGRMLASRPSFNIEAACQVAHAISVHPVVIEDDYFTAVDDLNDRSEDTGSAHIGETGFASGLFYSYVCINREQLVENLNGDKTLADAAVAALIETVVKVPPSGKQNSFAHQGYASYLLAESGNQQPRSLSVSYLKPIEVRSRTDRDYLAQAIDAIRDQVESFDQVYGPCAEAREELCVSERKGSLQTVLAFAAE
ncbi:MAG: type I-E CRISPR-associated protein Cas7/Cse4/CasC [Oceanospirillaceae bacterium]|nr:type I-E CRISPR-associated protein Cas7/Cse4/CasC [Oceanospirillaceae bacterium]